MKPKPTTIAVVAEGCLGVPNDEAAAGRRPKPAKRKPSDRPKVIAEGWLFQEGYLHICKCKIKHIPFHKNVAIPVLVIEKESIK